MNTVFGDVSQLRIFRSTVSLGHFGQLFRKYMSPHWGIYCLVGREPAMWAMKNVLAYAHFLVTLACWHPSKGMNINRPLVNRFIYLIIMFWNEITFNYHIELAELKNCLLSAWQHLQRSNEHIGCSFFFICWNFYLSWFDYSTFNVHVRSTSHSSRQLPHFTKIPNFNNFN